MTTKLTKAEVQALPCCRECGEPPSDYIAGKLVCRNSQCSVGGMSPETWRLLMTPEAKGEWNMTLDQAINHMFNIFENEKGWNSLQSKLAKSEDTNLMRVGQIEALREHVKTGDEELERVQREFDTHKEVAQKEMTSLKQQLAEATKPVRDDELEKAITYITQDKVFLGGLADSLKFVFRAARQRKPSGDYFDVVFAGEMPNLTFVEVEDANGRGMSPDQYSGCWTTRDGYKVLRIHKDKPSGDAVYLANAWKRGWSRTMYDAEYLSISVAADSILAQSAAGDSVAKEIVTASTEGVARVPAADSTVGAATDYGYFSTPIFMTDPLEIEKASEKIEEAQKNPTVTFSGVNTSWSKLNGAVDAIRKLLGDCAMIFRDSTLRDREEGEPHADVDGTGLRPAADLLTAMERKDLEFARAKDFRQIITWETAVDYLICMIDRLAPEPSAATPTEVKP